MEEIFKEITGLESDEELVARSTRNIEARSRLLEKGQDVDEIFNKIEANKSLFSKQELNSFHSWRVIRNQYLHAHILNVQDRNKFISDYKIFYSALVRETKSVTSSLGNLSILELFQVIFIATVQDLFSFQLEPTLKAVFRIIILFVILWLLFTFALPLIQMTTAIWITALAFYFRKYKSWLLVITLLVAAYNIFTWNSWYNFDMLLYFPSLANYFIFFLVANILSGIFAIIILIYPHIKRFREAS